MGVRARVLLLASAPATNADGLVVQQIGELSGEGAEAVAAEVAIVPFSSAIDARSTPILLASGKLFVRRDGEQGRWPADGGAAGDPASLRRRAGHPAARRKHARHRSAAPAARRELGARPREKGAAASRSA